MITRRFRHLAAANGGLLSILRAAQLDRRSECPYSALHGTAMRYGAERRNLDESIEELRQIADGPLMVALS
jgi:hypothetical protein